ncbi:hypothetical protein UFOVP236_46 [uncultured Caudovirales phage]|uniref:Phage gp6-like head-tail connector protein n=1 Tax=uncultured Caudovirales phage TaxID=2100421 RepID=A0A6J7WR59_9CAUD|nr:hypothetical protein UFOVP236_46 [uncultured Caudovirales phage]
MSTLQILVDDARVLLNDIDKNRYTDALLLRYANEAIAEAKRIRPDFFLGAFKTSLSTLALTDVSPIPLEYEAYVKDYVIARANSQDDEYSIDGRASAFMQRFKTGMMSI